ncbi:enoyl-CoA hydratase/isomerase family protein [Patulibacter minatonensis]|uniref:enoyl-CoA hydratase/isomerase family protein n=1 Tax=Patulibacter minatonensis TaxID=298163 RepID=UPI0004BC1349|nr:enoyl-CoA hydratase-related protein [Patulibacter minatonensis]
MTDKVLYEKRGPIAYVTLNRPDKLNAIDPDVNERLREIWTDFRDDDELRLAILTGSGDKAFCAGADLSTMVGHWTGAGPGLGRDALPNGFAGGITRGLHRTKKPVIAALNGYVIGGGLELALACDIRVAVDHAMFGSFELRRGMHPADGGIVRLVNICGAGIALELELTGEPIDAQRALQCNLISKVVSPEDLMETAEWYAEKILRNPQKGVESAKDTILEVIGRPLEDQLRIEALYGYSIFGNPEIDEERARFLAEGDPA